MKKKLKILFISHDSSYTGASLTLLQLIGWLVNNQKCRVRTILLLDGLLKKQFEGCGEVFVINSKKFFLKNLVFHILRNKFPSIYKLLLKGIFKIYFLNFQPDLIYCNTAVSIQLAGVLKDAFNCPILCHIHELEYGIENHLGSAIFNSNTRYVDHYIANSKATFENLHNKYSISVNKVDIIPPHIIFQNPILDKNQICEELGLKPEAFIVFGSGVNDWIKGVDLFIYTAAAFKKLTDRNYYFIWIGGRETKAEIRAKYEIEQLGLDNQVKLIGFRENPYDYINWGDVFFMSSRLESYGMAGLEAASLGKPVVCFDTARGMRDFIGNSAGYVINYPDVNSAANAIFELMNDSELKNRLGEAGRIKAKGEFSIEITGPKIWSVIENTID